MALCKDLRSGKERGNKGRIFYLSGSTCGGAINTFQMCIRSFQASPSRTLIDAQYPLACTGGPFLL